MKFFTVTANCRVADGRENFGITSVKRLPDTLSPDMVLLLESRFKDALTAIYSNSAIVKEITDLHLKIEDSQMEVKDGAVHNSSESEQHTDTGKESKALSWQAYY